MTGLAGMPAFLNIAMHAQTKSQPEPLPEIAADSAPLTVRPLTDVAYADAN